MAYFDALLQQAITVRNNRAPASNTADLVGGVLVAIVTALQMLLDDNQDALTFDTTPTADSPNPVTSDGIYQALQAIDLSACEKIVNKVTSIDAQSTDVQYPSAKLLYDSLQALSQVYAAIVHTHTAADITDLATVLADYVTTSALATALADYVTDTELATELANYVTSTALATALADYVTDTDLATALADYVTNSGLSTILADYVTNSGLSTILADYVTDTALATALADYVTAAALATTLADYVTSSSLATTLQGYSQTGHTHTASQITDLANTLAAYVTLAGAQTISGKKTLDAGVVNNSAYFQGVTTATLSAATYTIANLKAHTLTLAANVTITLPTVTDGAATLRLKFIQDATGGRSVTFAAASGIKIYNPNETDLSEGAANELCWVTLLWDGTCWVWQSTPYVSPN